MVQRTHRDRPRLPALRHRATLPGRSAMSARGRDQVWCLVGRAAIAEIAAGVEEGTGHGVEW